jgi:hypothetical protein
MQLIANLGFVPCTNARGPRKTRARFFPTQFQPFLTVATNLRPRREIEEARFQHYGHRIATNFCNCGRFPPGVKAWKPPCKVSCCKRRVPPGTHTRWNSCRATGSLEPTGIHLYMYSTIGLGPKAPIPSLANV